MTERERCRQLIELANRFGVGERAAVWINGGASVDEARSWLRERRRTPVSTAGDVLDLGGKDLKRYSVARAILQAAGEEPRGLESEVSDELRKVRAGESGATPRSGFMVPSSVVALRALDTLTPTAGAEAVFAEFDGFLDALRTRTMVLRMGAQTRGALHGTPTFVKQTSDATAHWVPESPGVDVAASQPGFSVVTMVPKTLQATVQFTRQELRRAVFDVNNVVERTLVAMHARAIDRAALHGTGLSDDPVGLANLPNVTKVPMGGAITYATAVALETAVVAEDADLGEMGYLTTPEVRGAAKTTEMFASSNGRPIWTGDALNGEMNGFRAGATNQIDKNLGVGTDEHGIFFGVWNRLVVGEWGVLELIPDSYTLKKQGIIEVTSFQMADIAVEYEEAFSFGTGLTV